MTFENNILQIKCDGDGCNKIAEYILIFSGKKKISLCINCTHELYTKIGKAIVPKSPNNMLNIDKKENKNERCQ